MYFKSLRNINLLYGGMIIFTIVIIFYKLIMLTNSYEYIKARHFFSHLYNDLSINLWDDQSILVSCIIDIFVFLFIGYILKYIKIIFKLNDIIIYSLIIYILFIWFFIIIDGNEIILANEKQYGFSTILYAGLLWILLYYIIMFSLPTVRKIVLQKYITYLPFYTILNMSLFYALSFRIENQHMLHVVFNFPFIIYQEVFFIMLIASILYFGLYRLRLIFRISFLISLIVFTLLYFIEVKFFAQSGKLIQPIEMQFSVMSEEFIDSVKPYLKTGSIITLAFSFLIIIQSFWMRVNNYKENNYKILYLMFILLFVISGYYFVFALNEGNKTDEYSKNPFIWYLTPIPERKMLDKKGLEDLQNYYNSLRSLKEKIDKNDPIVKCPLTKPNIIHISMESISKNNFGLVNDNINTTPLLNKRKNSMLIFDNYYTNSPISENTFFTINNSLYHAINEIVTVHFTKYPSMLWKGLIEELKQNNYRTAIFASTTLDFNNQKAFYARMGKLSPELYDIKNIEWDRETERIPWGIYDSATTRSIKKWISENKKEPFYIFFETMATHHPYTTFKEFNVFDNNTEYGRYLNGILYTDYVINDLIEYLIKEKLLDNTIIIMHGDHGEAFGEHPNNYTHIFNVYEENIHVPLIIFGQLITKDTIYIDTIGSHLDLAPTIFDICGLKSVNYMLGTSLLRKKNDDKIPVYFSAVSKYYGCRIGNIKYIFSDEINDTKIFNLSNDPEEKYNLYNNKYPNIQDIREQTLTWKDNTSLMLSNFKSLRY